MYAISILWQVVYMVFGFTSSYFALTTIKDKGLTEAPFLVRLFYWHGIVFVIVMVTVAWFFIGVSIYGSIR